FFLEIDRRTDMIGVAFISADPADKHKSVIAERTINNYVTYRRFPADRIKIVRTNSENDPFYFRFWMWSPDAALPDFGTIDDSLIISDKVKEPFLLASDNGFDGCPGPEPQKLFADFLNA